MSDWNHGNAHFLRGIMRDLIARGHDAVALEPADGWSRENLRAVEFLKELDANNDKTWWEANKDRYVRDIREPALDFIVDFGRRLTEISPHFTADARSQGGSLMRPYRDMRFSKGLPYKTNVGIHFRHALARDVHAPGFYLHIEPGQNFAGAGMWHPETKLARQIRQAINDDPDGWVGAAYETGFASKWDVATHEDDRLHSPPGRRPRPRQRSAHNR